MDITDWEYKPVPDSSSLLYRMCWQLESWLRTIVYVELRAAYVEWETPIKKHVQGKAWPPKSLDNDKQQHHMATHHQNALSYLTFGQLWDVISDPDYWPLFEPYFPPKDNTFARIDEIRTIRNRVAHFREPHKHDYDRLRLFLQDMEQGIRRFCSRYRYTHAGINVDENPVLKKLKESWWIDGEGTELLFVNDWLYAPDPHRLRPLMNASIDILSRSHPETKPSNDIIYDLSIRPHKELDVVHFFNQTQSEHKNIVHIILPNISNIITITIPAIHGPEKVSELILKFISAGLSASRGWAQNPIDKEFLGWPEYVLWPDNLLTFYDDRIQDPILLTD